MASCMKPEGFKNIPIIIMMFGGLLCLGAAFPSFPASIGMPNPPARFSLFFSHRDSMGISAREVPRRAKRLNGEDALNQAWRIHHAISISS